MEFESVGLEGACLVVPEKRGDDRGFFARVWCREELVARGLVADVAQANVSRTRTAGTVRGLHYQVPPVAEAKLVRCTRGAIHDVLVDLRPESPTRLQWTAVKLTADDHRMMYVPPGFAHGFQALTDGAEAFYMVSAPYSPAHERGARPDDPAFSIHWPLPITSVSEKDRSWPDFQGDDDLAGLGSEGATSESAGVRP